MYETLIARQFKAIKRGIQIESEEVRERKREREREKERERGEREGGEREGGGVRENNKLVQRRKGGNKSRFVMHPRKKTKRRRNFIFLIQLKISESTLRIE
jgi:hypothetical protein